MFEMAVAARKNAHCPYSKYQVGAAVKFKKSKQIFSGCNVENSSYGATICAERNAIISGVAAVGAQQIECLVLVTDNKDVVSPCAMCLQVISEFCDGHTEIHLANLKGIQKKVLFKELLPRPFEKSSLAKF